MKIFLDTIGCRLNQAEIESLARQFQLAGHEILPTAQGAELTVINTCTVTAQAASDSRAAVRRANRQGTGSVVVTGCWATLEPEKALALPGVVRVIPNPAKDSLPAALLGLPEERFDLEPLVRQPLPGRHHRTRAFIKAQDGCDNACTFCITRIARGASRSRLLEEVLLDVQAALRGGTQEIVLTGVQLGAWGRDLQPARHLADLVAGLLAGCSIPRLRLSSLEPWDLGMDLLALWSDPHLCRHLHLPLQSGSSPVLRRMARRITAEEFTERVASARGMVPQVAITTDLITGFPGETEAEFMETVDFVQAVGFSGGHVFPYSPRPGTPAARLQGQVRSDLAKERATVLRLALAESARAYRRKFIATTLPVLWEARRTRVGNGWQIEGLTDNYLRVVAASSDPRWNCINNVRLIREGPDFLWGEILE